MAAFALINVMVYEDLSYRVIGCCMAVHNSLGCALLEQCYHNALFYELAAAGLDVEYNMPFTVRYRNQIVGEYFADLVVEGKIIIELKSVGKLVEIHMAQLLNYLHIAKCRLGFLVNFQPVDLEWKRMALSG